MRYALPVTRGGGAAGGYPPRRILRGGYPPRRNLGGFFNLFFFYPPRSEVGYHQMQNFFNIFYNFSKFSAARGIYLTLFSIFFAKAL